MGTVLLICALATGQAPAPPRVPSAEIGGDGRQAPAGCVPRWAWHTRNDGVTGWTWGWMQGDRFYYYPKNQPPGQPPERPPAPPLAATPGAPAPAVAPRGKDGLVNYGLDLPKERGVGPRLDTNDPGFGSKLFDVVPQAEPSAAAAHGREVPIPERRSHAPAHDDAVRYWIAGGFALVAIAILCQAKRGH